MKRPIVIAIAAVSGGGKTTVVKSLNEELESSKALHFDDYDFEECPEDFFQWVQNGADYNEWNTSVLVDDIKQLLSQSSLEYILLDYPFAYKNERAKQYIDYAIFIDTPLDVAMARRIIRNMSNKNVDLLKDDLNYYLSKGRVAYLEMIKTIKPNSDFIIDGNLSTHDIVSKIIKKIKVLGE